MATAKTTTIRFTPHDAALLEVLQQKLGVVNQSDVLRMAIRALAEAHGIDPMRVKAKS
jgi:Arc/MetJ-type ribon-helix-helix transcriptional regulator